MEPSSSDQQNQQTNIVEGSFDETANSIHLQHGEQDRQMKELNPVLLRFIREQLQAGIKFDDLEQRELFLKHPKEVIKPFPFIYCLPHTILFLEKQKQKEQQKEKQKDKRKEKVYLHKLHQLHDQLQKTDIKYNTIRWDYNRKELNLRVHTESQLVFYNIRCLKADYQLHKDPKMLDGKYLVDKLVEYYNHFYNSIYFKETMVVVLYWAFQKDLLEFCIPEQALKLLIICNFINFGYGVDNVISTESQKPERINQYKKMRTFCKMFRGETKIMDELKQQFVNYSFLQKQGFYMAAKKRHMVIKELMPVWFPLLPLSKEQEEAHEKEIKTSLKSVVEYERQNISICKNISKLFKFWHNKFSKPMRFVVDLSETLGYRQEFSERFQLEIIHPVFHESICLLKEIQMKNFNREINQVYINFKKNPDSINCITKMFEKLRP